MAGWFFQFDSLMADGLALVDGTGLVPGCDFGFDFDFDFDFAALGETAAFSAEAALLGVSGALSLQATATVTGIASRRARGMNKVGFQS